MGRAHRVRKESLKELVLVAAVGQSCCSSSPWAAEQRGEQEDRLVHAAGISCEHLEPLSILQSSLVHPQNVERKQLGWQGQGRQQGSLQTNAHASRKDCTSLNSYSGNPSSADKGMLKAKGKQPVLPQLHRPWKGQFRKQPAVHFHHHPTQKRYNSFFCLVCQQPHAHGCCQQRLSVAVKLLHSPSSPSAEPLGTLCSLHNGPKHNRAALCPSQVTVPVRRTTAMNKFPRYRR